MQKWLFKNENHQISSELTKKYCKGFAESIARQRFDKHLAIQARSNRKNVTARC
jgi:hypothetical protein